HDDDGRVGGALAEVGALDVALGRGGPGRGRGEGGGDDGCGEGDDVLHGLPSECVWPAGGHLPRTDRRVLAFLTKQADVVQWQNISFPSCIRGFDARPRLHEYQGFHPDYLARSARGPVTVPYSVGEVAGPFREEQ